MHLYLRNGFLTNVSYSSCSFISLGYIHGWVEGLSTLLCPPYSYFIPQWSNSDFPESWVRKLRVSYFLFLSSWTLCEYSEKMTLPRLQRRNVGVLDSDGAVIAVGLRAVAVHTVTERP
jgi:hypothetical protein